MTKRIKKKIAIKFEQESRMLPFIKFRIDGVEKDLFALVDSGSEATLLDSRLVTELVDNPLYEEYEADTMTFEGIGGSKKEEHGKLFSLQLEITDVSKNTWNCPVMGAVTDMTAMQDAFKLSYPDQEISMLIGSDSLYKMKAEIRYSKQQVIFCGFVDVNDAPEEAA